MSKLVDYIRTHWHEVPDGVTIPDDVEFVVFGDHWGVVTPIGAGEPREWLRSSTAPDDIARFTPEPLPVEPDFELPTTPGALIIAHDSEDETRRVFLRTSTDYWADPESFYCDDMLIDPQPAIVIPNGIGVMDETDKRDRVGATGFRWTWSARIAVWVCDDTACGTIAVLDAEYGPLRFADEEVDR